MPCWQEIALRSAANVSVCGSMLHMCVATSCYHDSSSTWLCLYVGLPNSTQCASNSAAFKLSCDRGLYTHVVTALASDAKLFGACIEQ